MGLSVDIGTRSAYILTKAMPSGQKPTKNYQAEKRRFAHWLAMPELERLPVTQGLLADELGVHFTTLSKWKTTAFMKSVNDIVDEHLADEYAEAVDTLKREMRKGSFPHLRMYLEMIGKYIPKQAIVGDPDHPVVVKVLKGSTSVDDLRE